MMQIVEQTHEEKVAMYMKLPKEELIEMLIECNNILHKRPMVEYNIKEHKPHTFIPNYIRNAINEIATGSYGVLTCYLCDQTEDNDIHIKTENHV